MSDAIAAVPGKAPAPGLGRFGRLRSILRSVETRTGQIMPTVLARILGADSRLRVLTEVSLPVTRTALAVGHQEGIEHLMLTDDERAVRMLQLDNVVIERTYGHAILVDIKLGGAALSGTARSDLCAALQACSLTAPAALQRLKIPVASASWGIIDIFGNAGFSTERAIGLGGIDSFFDVPVRAAIETLLSAIGDALDRQLEPILTRSTRSVATNAAGEAGDGDAAVEGPMDSSRSVVLPNRLIGPAERRALAEAKTVRFPLAGVH